MITSEGQFRLWERLSIHRGLFLPEHMADLEGQLYSCVCLQYTYHFLWDAIMS